jgi:endonuclease-8
MPEGDTIHTIAAGMRPRLVGATVRELVLRDRGPIDQLVGATVDAIDVYGKNMVIRLGGDWGLRVHLGMRGRWRSYQPGEPWSWRRSAASVALVTDRIEVGCYRASKAELLRGVALKRHPALIALGPDLLAEQIDLAEVVRRARRFEYRQLGIAELLLDQRVAAGIGNVYKSEVLFLERIHPKTRVVELGDDQLRRLFARARELMQRNVGPGRRQTTTEGDRRLPDRRMLPDHYVYGRHHQPCLDCGSPVEVERTGDQARTSYWCPTCQPAQSG